MSLDFLVGGGVYGASLAFVAIAIPRSTRYVLATVLAVAALTDVPFAIAADAGAGWIAVELAGAGVFGYAAMRGIRGSAWWLVAGFALHAVLAVAEQMTAPGSSVAPDWYTTSCLGYDLAVAGITALAILVGTHLTDTPLCTCAGARGAAAAQPSRRWRKAHSASRIAPEGTCCAMGACVA